MLRSYLVQAEEGKTFKYYSNILAESQEQAEQIIAGYYRAKEQKADSFFAVLEG